MKPTRKLSLRRETLAELSARELGGVAAASGLPDCRVPTVPVHECTEQTLTFCPDYYCTGTC